jgi:hypothetical protein
MRITRCCGTNQQAGGVGDLIAGFTARENGANLHQRHVHKPARLIAGGSA